MSKDRFQRKLLSKVELDEYATGALGLSADQVGTAAYKSNRKYLIPDNAGQKALIANQLVANVHKRWTLFGSTDWGVWPTAEVPGLFTAVRASRGYTEPIWEKRGEIVGPEDSEYLCCLVAVALYASWDVLLIDLEGGNGAFCSHDDWMCAMGPDRAFRRKLTKMMHCHGPKFLGWQVEED